MTPRSVEAAIGQLEALGFPRVDVEHWAGTWRVGLHKPGVPTFNGERLARVLAEAIVYAEDQCAERLAAVERAQTRDAIEQSRSRSF